MNLDIIVALAREKEIEIDGLKERLNVAQSDLMALKRTLELAGYKEEAGATAPQKPSLTIGDAVYQVLSSKGKPMHADDIVHLIYDLGVHSSKATVVSQMLRDARLIKVGKNVFRLRRPTDEDERVEEKPNQNAGSKKPAMADIAIDVLREIGYPVTTGELRNALIKKGLFEASKNLFPALHTALRRREGSDVRLGAGNKWMLTAWINSSESLDFDDRPDNVSQS